MTLRPLLALLTTAILLLTVIQTSSALKIPCDLVWIHHTEHDPIPENAVSTSNITKYYIARIYNRATDSWKIGSAEEITGHAHIHDGEYVEYELLTNPNGCHMEWVRSNGPYGYWTPIFAVSAGDHGNFTSRHEYVGRSLVAMFYLAGTAKTDVGRIEFGEKTTMNFFQGGRKFPTFLKSYQILRSYQNGLEQTLIDLEIQTGRVNEDFDYIGMDEIQNDGEGTVSQTITHSTKVRELFSLTHTGSRVFNSSDGIKFVNSDILKIDLNASHILEWVDGLTFETWSEKEVSISRQITVLPRTSIQACSTVKISTTLSSEFNGTSVFRGKGMSGDEVYNFLRDLDQDIDMEIVDDTVHVPISGTVTATSAIATRFIILPADTMQNCDLVAQTAKGSAAKRNREIRHHLKGSRKRRSLNNPDAPEMMTFKKDPKRVSKFPGVKAARARKSTFTKSNSPISL